MRPRGSTHPYSTCRAWYNLMADPSLWKHVHLESMEFRSVVVALRELNRLCVRLVSLSIVDCYSNFIENTTVPIANLPTHHGRGPFYSHITNLTRDRRREEYAKFGFTLHH